MEGRALAHNWMVRGSLGEEGVGAYLTLTSLQLALADDFFYLGEPPTSPAPPGVAVRRSPFPSRSTSHEKHVPGSIDHALWSVEHVLRTIEHAVWLSLII